MAQRKQRQKSYEASKKIRKKHEEDFKINKINTEKSTIKRKLPPRDDLEFSETDID